jgi:hypothetical protein
MWRGRLRFGIIGQNLTDLVQPSCTEKGHFCELAVAVVINQMTDEICALFEDVSHLFAKCFSILAVEENTATPRDRQPLSCCEVAQFD